MPLILTEKTGINLAVDGGNLDVSADAADILTLIKTVDGATSGLDADLLDGQEATAFATEAQGSLADSALQSADISGLASESSGFWTPAFSITGDGSVAMSVQSGTYVKIGSLCIASFRITTGGSPGGGSGNVSITGLPFPATDWGNLSVGRATGFANTDILLRGYVGPTDSHVSLVKNATNASDALVGSADMGSEVTLHGVIIYEVAP